MLLKKGIIVSITETSSMIEEFKVGDVIRNSNIFPSMKIVRKNEIIDSSSGYDRIHLYLFIQEGADVGDYELDIDNDTTKIVKPVKRITSDCVRLVATTNKDIPSARLSKKFLNEYVENNGIDEVKVVYVETADKLVISKNKRNIIELGQLKDQYTGVEVVDKIMELVEEVYDNELMHTVVEWCDDNI